MSATETISVQKEVIFSSKEKSSFQKEASSYLANTGIPTRKSEEWRYTPIKRLFDAGLRHEDARAIDGVAIQNDIEPITDFHNKSFIPALCVAGAHGIGLIESEGNSEIELIGPSTSNTLWTRYTQIRVTQGRSGNLVIRSNVGHTTSLVADFVEISVEADASLELVVIEQGTGNQALSIAVRQDEGSRFTATTVTLGGNLVRNELNVAFEGPQAECHLYGLFLASGTDLIDNHTLVDHRVPDCTSNELYKGVLAGKSTGVFNGKVYVQRDAQRTNGFQQNRNIIIGDQATMNSKPELEIYADDVKCSHGSTTGQLDDEALFYLRSRGLGVVEATGLLLTAFADDVVASLGNEEIRNEMSELIRDRMSGLS